MSDAKFNLAVVGATGAVGQEILSVLERRNFPAASIKLLASERSAGKTIHFRGRDLTVEAVKPESFEGVDLAFFSAGATRSKEFIPFALRAGAIVVDNSSAFRMKEDVPLVVPEVNAADIEEQHGLIANPNCCAAILAVAIWPLHQKYKIKRITVSTYQSASGAGAKALEELQRQMQQIGEGKEPTAEVFPFPLAGNVFSHNTPVARNGYNDEENKLAQEIRKIFHAPEMEIIPTCIRVPVPRAHSESIVIDTELPIPPAEAKDLLASAPGLKIVDNDEAGHYPMPIEASGDLDVHVGRIRSAYPNSLALFVSGDQLLKGAAWNAVQIGEHLVNESRLTAV
ncbi:MAG: aspartate-semialdehyde dehydrogenase [Verrucomicrobiota bacterium]